MEQRSNLWTKLLKCFLEIPRKEMCRYIAISSLLIVWFPYIGETIHFVSELYDGIIYSLMVLSFWGIIWWYKLISQRCYIPRLLNACLVIGATVLLAGCLHSSSFAGEVCFVLLVDLAFALVIDSYCWINLEKKESKTDADNFLLRDAPSNEDDYQRKSIVETIVYAIMQDANIGGFKHGEGSFVFNINESYGAGKSSCMNLLKTNLDARNIKYLEFLPWRTTSISNMVEDFFIEFQNALSQFVYIKEKWYVGQYAKMLVKNIAALSDVAFLQYNQGLNKKYQSIWNLMANKIKRPIVVIVDDVDRLMRDELWGLLNIVRNMANFPYLYFVLNADMDYVETVLASENRDRNDIRDFLKKVINLQILFPMVDNSLITRLFDEKLAYAYGMLKNKSIDEIPITVSLLSDTSKSCLLLFNNLREIKRFTNTLVFSIHANLNSSENDKFLFSDFVKLELIKYFSPSVFRLLRENPLEILHTKDGKRYVLKDKYKEIVTRKIVKEFDDVVQRKKTRKTDVGEDEGNGEQIYQNGILNQLITAQFKSSGFA